MKYGVTLRGVHPREFPALAKAAEEHGFESIWLPDHIFFPAEVPATFPYTADNKVPVDPQSPIYDPLIVLASIASATSTIKLGTNVFILPLRHPVVTAHSVATLDQLSGGRVLFGVGVGWLADEFTTFNVPFEERGRRTDECIELMRELWASASVENHHGSYPLRSVVSQPRPVQCSAGGAPAVPIHVGGVSKPAIRRAARLGDGWIQAADGKDLADLALRIKELDVARERYGRSGLPWEVTSRLGIDLDAARGCADLGVARIVAAGPAVPSRELTVQHFHDWFDQFAEQVISNVP